MSYRLWVVLVVLAVISGLFLGLVPRSKTSAKAQFERLTIELVGAKVLAIDAYFSKPVGENQLEEANDILWMASGFVSGNHFDETVKGNDGQRVWLYFVRKKVDAALPRTSVSEILRTADGDYEVVRSDSTVQGVTEIEMDLLMNVIRGIEGKTNSNLKGMELLADFSDRIGEDGSSRMIAKIRRVQRQGKE